MYPLLFGRLGLTEILIILLIVVLFFGGKKIPELMRGMGHGVREFKDALQNPPAESADEAEAAETPSKQPARKPRKKPAAKNAVEK